MDTKNIEIVVSIGCLIYATKALINGSYFIATVLLIAFGFIAAISIMKSIKTK